MHSATKDLIDILRKMNKKDGRGQPSQVLKMIGNSLVIFLLGLSGTLAYSSDYQASDNSIYTVLHPPNLATYCFKYCAGDIKKPSDALTKKCYCECPLKFEFVQKLYPIFMVKELLAADAFLLNGNKINNLKYYCPVLNFKENSITITAWNKTLTATSQSKFNWNSYKQVVVDAPGASGVKATFGRLFYHPQGKFSIFVLCLEGGPTYWVVHTPNTKKLSYTYELLIFRILKSMGYNTAQIYRPDYSSCGASYNEEVNEDKNLY